MLELTPQELANQLEIVGHGAIRFGVAYGLQNADGTAIPSVEYFARELLSSVYEIRMSSRPTASCAARNVDPRTRFH